MADRTDADAAATAPDPGSAPPNLEPDPVRVVGQLELIYDESVSALRRALAAYLRHGQRPTADDRLEGVFAYPELRLHYARGAPIPRPSRAFGLIRSPGDYAVTITRPALYRDYLIEQLELLIRDYDVDVQVVRSRHEIPYPYVLDGAEDLLLDEVEAQELARWFPTTTLSQIGDEVADGMWSPAPGQARPLALFYAARADFSLARLKHYTGTAPEDFQRYVLFTNYTRYVDEFVRWGTEQVRAGDRYSELVLCGGEVVRADSDTPGPVDQSVGWRRRQMPAYHLKAQNRRGITLVNIGVGPSNAKTITDHLAVLRPDVWLMIGHCGGLRPSQTIGDYVLAHAYLRDDHVLDDVLPVEIPIPPIAEVQRALYDAAERISAEPADDLKRRLRTGTVVTTDDRNWELRYTASSLRFNQSRAVAIDMESATIAAQGYRFRVPYGTLLCISDKPLHGEIKLPGQANRFYERAVSEHLMIGIAAIDLLREEGPGLHSRKLRAFDEPPFR